MLYAFHRCQLCIQFPHLRHRLMVPDILICGFLEYMTVISSNKPRVVVACFNQISYLYALNYCIGFGCLNSQHNLFRKFEDRMIYSKIYIFWHFLFIKVLVLDSLIHIHCKMGKSCHEMWFHLRSKIRFCL